MWSGNIAWFIRIAWVAYGNIHEGFCMYNFEYLDV